MDKLFGAFKILLLTFVRFTPKVTCAIFDDDDDGTHCGHTVQKL